MTSESASHAHPPDISARGLWKVAWPIMISRMSQSVVGLCDTQMVSALGTSAVAAASTGAMNSFAILIFPLAMIFLVSSFCSQMYGQGDVAGARRFGWYGLFLAMVMQVVCIVGIWRCRRCWASSAEARCPRIDDRVHGNPHAERWGGDRDRSAGQLFRWDGPDPPWYGGQHVPDARECVWELAAD